MRITQYATSWKKAGVQTSRLKTWWETFSPPQESMQQDGKEEEEEGKNNNSNSFQFRDLQLFRLHFVAGVPWLYLVIPSVRMGFPYFASFPPPPPSSPSHLAPATFCLPKPTSTSSYFPPTRGKVILIVLPPLFN